MKSFKNFLIEEDKVNRSIGDVKNQNELIKKYKKSSNVQPELFDTSKVGKENIVKDVKTPQDIIGDRKKRGRPVGSTNKKTNTTNVQTQLDLNKTNNKTNKVNTNKVNTNKVDLTKRPNIRNPIYKNNLELYRKHQDEYKALKSKNNVVSINKNKSTKNVINTNKQGSLSDLFKQNEIKGANKNKGIPSTDKVTRSYGGRLQDTISGKDTISFDIKGANKSSTKGSVDIPDFLKKEFVKNKANQRFTTRAKNVIDLPGFLKRGQELTGTAPLNPQLKVDGKRLPVTPSKEVLKQTPKGLRVTRAIGALGRIAGGAYAVKDFADTARKEKALGRGKTAARLAGASRALGGYIGGGIGATLGSGVGSLPGGIAGGAAGYYYGSKLGDQIYQTGRDLALGKKTFKQLRKDIGDKTRKFNILKAPGNR